MSNRACQSGSQPPEVTRHEAAEQVREAVTAFVDRFHAGEQHFALHGHHLDTNAIAVLQRLSESGRNSDQLTAAEAIVAALPREGWDILFADCVLAELRARNHKAWMGTARMVLDRYPQAEKALDLAERFLGRPWPPERRPKPRSRDPNVVELRRLARGPVDDALDLLRSAEAMKRRLASEHLQLFSRKTTPDGARAEGIGWVRESLIQGCRRAGREPKPRYLAAIATAALDMGEITEDAARKAPMPTERLDDLYRWRVRGVKT
jgi:hypothetical protein